MDAYFGLVKRLADTVNGHIDEAREFNLRNLEREQHSRHMANADMQGTSRSEARDDSKVQKWYNAFGVLTQTLGSFNQLLKLVARHTTDGQGYLYKHFSYGLDKAIGEEWRRKEAVFAALWPYTMSAFFYFLSPMYSLKKYSMLSNGMNS